VSGRHRGFEVAGVDHLAPHGHLVQLAAAQVTDLLAACPLPEVLVLAEQADPSRLGQPRRRRGEVLAHLRPGRPLVVAGVLAGLVDAVLAERQRADPVVGGRAVQADERIRVLPMAPGLGPAVDQGHLDVGLRRQSVGEGEAAGAGSDDQVIGLDEHASPR
jgi:hypothetical protein